MAFRFSPKIVTDGLVLYLDAANNKSYPGTGVQVNDLCLNAPDGTLTNGAYFSGDSSGYFVFDGDNDYIELGSITPDNPLMLNGSSLSVCAFVKKVNVGNGLAHRIIDKGTSSSGVGGYGVWVQGQRLGYSTNGSNWRTTDTECVSLNEWNYICIVSGPSSTTSYINGIEYPGSYYTASYTTPPNTTANLRIGTWYNAVDREWFGNIASVKIYNRALTTEEITQNYNTTKSRFGL